VESEQLLRRLMVLSRWPHVAELVEQHVASVKALLATVLRTRLLVTLNSFSSVDNFQMTFDSSAYLDGAIYGHSAIWQQYIVTISLSSCCCSVLRCHWLHRILWDVSCSRRRSGHQLLLLL